MYPDLLVTPMPRTVDIQFLAISYPPFGAVRALNGSLRSWLGFGPRELRVCGEGGIDVTLQVSGSPVEGGSGGQS